MSMCLKIQQHLISIDCDLSYSFCHRIVTGTRLNLARHRLLCHPLHQGLEIGQKTVVVNKKGDPLYQVNPLFLIRYVVIE